MILSQDPVTDYWNRFEHTEGFVLATHEPWDCVGPLCDIHDRRGAEPWASWPLNWRSDRSIMEIICPHGIGHPSPAQAQFWQNMLHPSTVSALMSHGCDGCCANAYDQLSENA